MRDNITRGAKSAWSTRNIVYATSDIRRAAKYAITRVIDASTTEHVYLLRREQCHYCHCRATITCPYDAYSRARQHDVYRPATFIVVSCQHLPSRTLRHFHAALLFVRQIAAAMMPRTPPMLPPACFTRQDEDAVRYDEPARKTRDDEDAAPCHDIPRRSSYVRPLIVASNIEYIIAAAIYVYRLRLLRLFTLTPRRRDARCR